MAEAKAIFADNDELVDDLVKEKLIQSPNIEHVFRVVDRGDYFLPDHKENAYKRSAWKSGAFHLSSPGIYSMVMENLRLAPGLSFLNIGSGTGYLSTMAGLILGFLGVNHGVEIFADVKDYAEQNLRELKTKIPGLSYPQFCEPIFVKGNGLCLPKEINKYNRVYCGAECPENFVEYMKNLIKVDGILVMPVNSQLLQITRVSETLWEQKTISRVSFSPLQLPTLQDHLIPLKLPNFSSLHVASGSSDQLKPTVQHGSEINNMMNSSQEDTKLCPSLPSGKDEGNTVKKVVVEEIDSPAQSQSELLEDLRKITGRLHELLECPICFGTMDSSLIQCKNGHGICSTCVKSIEKCPTCKQDLVVYQSTLFGKILESLPKLCHYFDVGCSVILIDNDHETYCKFRPSSCKNTQCDWSGNVKDLYGHVKTCVKNKVCEISPLFSTQVPRYFYANRIQNMFYSPVIFNNQLFWEGIHKDVTKKCVTYKFYHVATSKPTYNYYFKVSFKKGQIEHVNTFKVFLDDDVDRCGETGIIFPDAELERFKNTRELDKYEYSIELIFEEIS